MIIYFSGTGNSRYIAKRIAAALQEKTLEINDKIKSDDTSALQTGSDVTVVAPTYAWRIPGIVSKWIERTEFIGAQRIRFVMDCGSEIGNAAKYNREIAAQKNLQYMGTAQIVMPENYIAMFDAPQKEKARKIVAKAEPGIDDIINRIKNEQSLIEPGKKFYYRLISGPMNPLFYKFFVKAKAFRASDACSGCGLCVKNCPMNNVRIERGKPVWGSKCTHCMACICHCPAEAIEYGKKSVGKPRYNFEKL